MSTRMCTVSSRITTSMITRARVPFLLYTGIIYLKPTKYSLKLLIHKDPKNNLSCHTFRENQANCNYLYIKSEQK